MDIEKAKDNFNKDGKSKCFNCNIYRYMAKDCKKLKKEQDIRKCYKYKKIGHITKDCRSGQKIKNKSIQEDLDTENEDKEQDFENSPKYAWYKEPL